MIYQNILNYTIKTVNPYWLEEFTFSQAQCHFNCPDLLIAPTFRSGTIKNKITGL